MLANMDDYYNFLPRTAEEYLNTRVLDQIQWYDKKSAANKKWFLSLKIGELVLALSIPFLSGYLSMTDYSLRIVLGILGMSVAAIAGLITLIKFQENWIEYRTVAESLKMEKFLFLSNAGPYKRSDEAFPMFVERFESLISNSTKKWINYVNEKETKHKQRD